jgi:ABC-2 type transport system permease protein
VEEMMNIIYMLWLREVKRYLRSRAQIVASMGQPLLYLLVLGFGLGPVFQKSGNGSYVQFIAPGMVGMTILFTSTFSGVGLLFDRQLGALKATLVSPAPRTIIMIGRTLGGATVAVIQGLLVFIVCLIAGFRPVSLAAIPAAFFFMAIIAIVFGGLGTAIGSALKDIQGFQLIINFIVMPMFFLSGALFPLTNLPKLLGFATTVDPLSYGIDGLRSALIGISHYGMGIDALVLVVIAAAFQILGGYFFSKIEI